ncbi:MAG: transposase, partial [Elainellaceae cyanobacterium]
MLVNAIHHKQLPFHAVLMDTWYATKALLLLIEALQRVYYCPLKSNRLVDDSGGGALYRYVDSLAWNESELERGKTIKIKGFPKDHKVKLFRVAVSSHRTDSALTNDEHQDSTSAAQE